MASLARTPSQASVPPHVRVFVPVLTLENRATVQVTMNRLENNTGLFCDSDDDFEEDRFCGLFFFC